MRRSSALALAAALTAGALVVAVGDVSDAQPKKADAEDKAKGGKGEKKASKDDKDKKKGAKGKKGETEQGPKVVSVKGEGDGGVKTYKFGPVEVEGRLKSPQIIYFLRRVRAEFAAGRLGHRSFMRELSDTRRSPALK